MPPDRTHVRVTARRALLPPDVEGVGGAPNVVNQRLERPSACSLSARFHREKRPQCVRSSSSDQSRSPTIQTPLPAVLRRSQRSQRQQTPKSTRSHRVGRYLMSTRSKRRRGGMPCACGPTPQTERTCHGAAKSTGSPTGDRPRAEVVTTRCESKKLTGGRLESVLAGQADPRAIARQTNSAPVRLGVKWFRCRQPRPSMHPHVIGSTTRHAGLRSRVGTVLGQLQGSKGRGAAPIDRGQARIPTGP